MSELNNKINELRTLKKSYSDLADNVIPISDLAIEVQKGKQELVDALAMKNVYSSTSETLSALASDVRSITQSPITIDGGEMYEKQLFGSLETPNYWNLYTILNNLLSDGRLLTYGGIVLAEYENVYDSIPLAGAGAGGAYVVSELDIAGAFKMYTEDITHTWDTKLDLKGNRWVAYCFSSEYHDFQITDSNISPISIFVGRKVGTISFLVNNKISDIVVPDGNILKSINTGTFTTEIGPEIILRNLDTITTKIIYNNTRIRKAYISAKEINLGNSEQWPCILSGATNLKSLIIEVNRVVGGILYGVSIPFLCIKAETIHSGTSNVQNTLQNGNFSNVILLDVEEITGNISGFANGRTVIDKYIYIGYKVNDRTRSCRISSAGTDNLIAPDLEIKEGWCKPLNVAGCENLTEENIINHILKHLKQDEDMCGSGVTITLGATNLAKLTSEEAVALLDSLTNIYGYTFA